MRLCLSYVKLPPKSCQLDPIPTKLLMDCPLIFASIFSSLINMSLEQAHVPASLKVAHITPLLKKPSLDRNCLQNYRPVSNLPFLFKVLEKKLYFLVFHTISWPMIWLTLSNLPISPIIVWKHCLLMCQTTSCKGWIEGTQPLSCY